MGGIASSRMYARLALVALASIVALVSTAGAAETVVPGLIPQRVILSWSGDPTNSQSVTWRTIDRAEKPVGQLAPLTADVKLAEKAATVDAKANCVPVGDGRAFEHEVTFNDLQPGTRYVYRVGDGNNTWSPWYQFRTASDKPEPFSFVYMGDAQAGLYTLWSRVAMASLLKAPDMRFMLHAGDLVNRGHDDALWGEWCAALGPIAAMVPQVPASGNHDQIMPEGDPTTMPQVAPWWRHRFALPNNGPQGFDFMNEAAYYLDYQGLRIIVIDTNLYDYEDQPDDPAQPQAAAAQTAWLEGVLKDNPNRWTVVTHHHPFYSTANERDNAKLREILLPLYDKYHVDLVLQGHDHHYGRSKKLFNNEVVDPAAPGTVYAVSMSGAKMYKRNPKFEPLMAKMQGDTQLFQVINVSNDRLTYRAYSVADELIDGFDLLKDQEGKTILQEAATAQ